MRTSKCCWRKWLFLAKGSRIGAWIPGVECEDYCEYDAAQLALLHAL